MIRELIAVLAMAVLVAFFMFLVIVNINALVRMFN